MKTLLMTDHMKKLLIVLLLFIFTGCTDTSTDEKNTLYKGFCCHIKIIRIGNHQYLEYYDGCRGSICHYEDCDYCKQHRGY